MKGKIAGLILAGLIWVVGAMGTVHATVSCR
jgi:hypothetical protein